VRGHFRLRRYFFPNCESTSNLTARVLVINSESKFLHPHKWDFWIHHRRSAEKEPNRTKQLYIWLTGSCAVTNRYTSEAQLPAPGTSHFWDILGGRKRPWGWVLGLSFCVWLFFCFSIFVFMCSRLSLCLFLAL
jgi:hypothetical protein